jgi:agmatinase
MQLDRAQFLGIPSLGPEQADAVILPVPMEKTVSYGRGTGGGPQAIIDASMQIETFDETALVEFAEGPRLWTAPAVDCDCSVEECLRRIESAARPWRDRFLLALGGEHLISYGVVLGMADNLGEITIVHIDAHADLIDKLDGLRWSHGTVMRRLWERGCRLVQVGVRSLSSEEYELASSGPRISTYYAHQLPDRWPELMTEIAELEGRIFLSIDVDGLDPAIIPCTGTPLPDGLTWRQMMEIIRGVCLHKQARLIGADVVELVPSPTPPGSDPAAARLVSRLLAWWWRGRVNNSGANHPQPGPLPDGAGTRRFTH